MVEEDFPSEITKSNINQLMRRAERIEKKTDQTRYGLSAMFALVLTTFFIVSGSLRIVIWLASNHYLDFILILSSEWQIGAFFLILTIITSVISFPILILVALLISWIMRKYFGFPKHEEEIFANCFITAKHLMNNDRMKAKENASSLLDDLKGFVRDYFFNPKRRLYAPEFNFLRCGKDEFYRMLFFSKEATPELLMRFGLAFVRNDDSMAYSHLTKLVKLVCEYGEPKGRMRRVLGNIEQYSNSLTFVLALVVLIISLLLTIFGYPLRSVS